MHTYLGKYYYPCGAAANAMFTDKFLKLEHVKDGDNSEIELKDDASLITWDIEKKYKYKNPKGVNLGRTSNQNKAEVKRFKRKFVQPKKWTDAVYQDFWDKGGVENPHFINWMHQGGCTLLLQIACFYPQIDIKSYFYLHVIISAHAEFPQVVRSDH